MIKALNAQPAQRSNKTTDEVKRWFIDHGLTVSEWAIQHQFNPALVYAVLHGRRRSPTAHREAETAKAHRG